MHVCLFVPHCLLLKSFRIMSVNIAAIIGNLGPFDEKSEKFSDYADRFEAYVAKVTSTMTKK